MVQFTDNEISANGIGPRERSIVFPSKLSSKDCSNRGMLLCHRSLYEKNIYYFSFCIRDTGNQTALYSFSRRMDQQQVRPLLHFENYASCNENGWSLNLMFSGTKDCHFPSLSHTLFPLPHRGNLGMYKCFCKIYSIVFKFKNKNFSIWSGIRTYFKRINHWHSNSVLTEVEGFFNPLALEMDI